MKVNIQQPILLHTPERFYFASHICRQISADNCVKDKKRVKFSLFFPPCILLSSPHPPSAGKHSQILLKLSLEVKLSLDKHVAQEMLWITDHLEDSVYPLPRDLFQTPLDRVGRQF